MPKEEHREVRNESTVDAPEVWLRGPIPKIPPLLMPIAHALLQAQEEIDRLAPVLTDEQLNERMKGSASPGFHLRHIAGSIDRLSTYARGEGLTEEQRSSLTNETRPSAQSVEQLVTRIRDAITRVLKQMENVGDDDLLQPRKVGRAGLPSNVIGLYVHLAEHASRHTGQLITTVALQNALKKQQQK